MSVVVYTLLVKHSNQRILSSFIMFHFQRYESILLQLDKNPNMARLLHNDKLYPKFNTLKELLAHPDSDPFGIQSQFEQFLTARVPYPILLVRYDVMQHLDGLEKLESIIENTIGYWKEIRLSIII